MSDMVEPPSKSLFLSPSELLELTGYQMPKRQINALLTMGLTFTVRPDGTPVVLREYLEHQLGLIPNRPKFRKTVEPNFAAMYATKKLNT